MTTGICNTSAPTSPNNAEGYSVGNGATTDHSATISKFQFYGSDDQTPSRVFIYDVTASAALLDLATTTWTWNTLSAHLFEADLAANGVSPLPVVPAGHRIKFGAYLGHPNQTQPLTVTSSLAAGWSVPESWYQNAQTNNPTGHNDGIGYAIDLVEGAGGGGGGSGGSDGSTGTGGPTFTGDLEAWLSSVSASNLHKTDGLPWLTKAGVDALAASLGNAVVLPGGTLSGGVAGLATQLTAGILAIKGVNGGTIAEVLTALGSLLQGLAALKSLLDGSGGGGRLGGAPDDGVTLIGQHQEIEDLINATSVLIADQSRRPPVGGDGWEFLANTEVTPNLAWDQMADAYLLNLSAYPTRYFGGDKSAGTYLPQIGWWAPLNGDFAGRQEPIRFAKSMLTVPGFRCAGVAVELKTGSVGVIEAWRYAG